MKPQYLFALVAGLFEVAAAQSSFSPARPPAIPLAVKSPYMSTWQQAGSDGGNGGYLAGQWPTFWAGQITGWTGLVRVDNITYTWMGKPLGPPVVTQTAFEYTSTKSIFTLNVNNTVQLKVTFLSPLTPSDMRRQSLPFSYLDVGVSSIDGAQHNVQLYTDVSAEWVSGDRNAIAQWDYGVINGAAPVPKLQSDGSFSSEAGNAGGRVSPDGNGNDHHRTSTVSGFITSQMSAGSRTLIPTVATVTYTTPTATTTVNPAAPIPAAPTHAPGGIAYHKFYRQTQLLFSETADQADWGNWYWATNSVANLTYQSGADIDVRGSFTARGYLPDTSDTNYRSIQANYPVFGFAVDLGSVGASSVDTLFTLALAQQQAVQFNGANGTVSLPSLWTSYFANDLDAVSFFHGDYSNAVGGSFDTQVRTDSLAVGGQDYLTLTSLATRQAFGATQFCGTPSKPYLFLKEISSDGNTQTVDVLFPLHPMLVYTNPMFLKLHLDPLFENQESGKYPNQYSMHDLGSHYPNATGHPLGDDEKQPLEECGNMLIMTLAYAQRANDTSYLAQHYSILNQWTQYLIAEALIPANQISTDDFAGSLVNQTNLALKGIIAIEAMAVIANLTGHANDGQNYTNIAHDYINRWQQLGMASNANPPHTTLSYGMNDTHGLLYNLYADAELGLNLVPRSVYDIQSAFYPTVEMKYGVPLDTRHSYTKSDWQMFCAAVASQSTRQMFIRDMAKWVNETPTNRAMSDLYNAGTGDYPPGIFFTARPVVGGQFALLVLQHKGAAGLRRGFVNG